MSILQISCGSAGHLWSTNIFATWVLGREETYGWSKARLFWRSSPLLPCDVLWYKTLWKTKRKASSISGRLADWNYQVHVDSLLSLNLWTCAWLCINFHSIYVMLLTMTSASQSAYEKTHLRRIVNPEASVPSAYEKLTCSNLILEAMSILCSILNFPITLYSIN